jgi:hypothetical protein
MLQALFLAACFAHSIGAFAFELAREKRDVSLVGKFPSTVQFRRQLIPQNIYGKEGLPNLFDGCTAVKLSAHRFLTAGHCEAVFLRIYGNEDLVLRSQFGEQRISQRHVKFVPHPKYLRFNKASSTYDTDTNFDLAIVQIRERTPQIPAARLAAGNVTRGLSVFVGGYGTNTLTGSEGELDMDLRRIDAIHAHTFCFRSDIRGAFRSAINYGDSGGPVWVELDDGFFVVGINSFRQIQESQPGAFVFLGERARLDSCAVNFHSDEKLAWIKSFFAK